MNTPSPASMDLALRAIEAVATVAFACSGLLQAARKRLDAVGASVVAGLAALGGVLRDIVCNEIPSALRDRRPDAICAFAGRSALVTARWLGAADGVGLLAAAMVAALLGGLALLTRFTLPRRSPAGCSDRSDAAQRRPPPMSCGASCKKEPIRRMRANAASAA